MKKRLTDNLALKILAILCSIALWLVVINIEDPVIRRTFSNIPVTITNTDSITEQGKVFEVLDDTDVIDVTVSGKRSVMSTITRDSIVATADMRELTFMNTVRIQLAANDTNGELENLRSDTENLKVNVEDIKRVQMVIETTTLGEPGEGYLLGEVSTDQNLVRLSGPESRISRVARAAVEVSVDGITTGIQANYPIHLYDADGNEIEDKSITKSINNITVSVSILQKKEVPLRFLVSGEPAPGYQTTGEITSSPASVVIAGRSSVVNSIAEIVVPEEALNVTGQSGDMTTIVSLKQYLPDGVTLANPDFSGKVSVTVHVEKEETADIAIEARNIVLQNVPQDWNAQIQDMEEPVTVQAVGLAEHIARLENLTITGYVDMTLLSQNGTLREGSYQSEVTLNLPDGVTLASPFTVTIQVTPKETEAETGGDGDETEP